MARNSQTALYINDPVKIVAGVFTIRQAAYVAGIVVLTYALINATSHLPYGQSAAGQLHLLLVVGVPAGLGLLVMTFGASGTVEPYARQVAGYLWRTTLALPRRLAYRAARLARRLRPARRGSPLVYGPILVADGTAAPGMEAAAGATASQAVPAAPARAPSVAPVVMTTPVAQTQRARLLAWLAAHPCVTDEQIAEGTGLNPSAARPRRRELVEVGVVRRVDDAGRTRAGRRAARWAVVREARETGASGEVAHGAA